MEVYEIEEFSSNEDYDEMYDLHPDEQHQHLEEAEAVGVQERNVLPWRSTNVFELLLAAPTLEEIIWQGKNRIEEYLLKQNMFFSSKGIYGAVQALVMRISTIHSSQQTKSCPTVQ